MDFLDENEGNGGEYLGGWVENKFLGSILQICSIWGVDLRGGRGTCAATEGSAREDEDGCGIGRGRAGLSGAGE